MNRKITIGLSGLALALNLSGPAQAADYCAIPLFVASNIRHACEQYGAEGLGGLYHTNRVINELMLRQEQRKPATAAVTRPVAAVIPTTAS